MRVLEIVRLTYGLVELIAPSALSGAIEGEKPDSRARTVIRVLGGRHTAQALLTMGRGRRRHAIGGVVDLIHASTAAIFALREPRWRRTASLSAAVSVAFAAGELL